MGKDSIGNKNDIDEICTCKESCPYDCKGQCGCEYCNTAWMDYLSNDWD